MEEILSEVKSYDIPKLRERLLEVGVKVGPISPATKTLFQKRLANKIFELQGGVREDREDENSQTPQPNIKKEETTVENAPSKEPDAYFVVCLPENCDSEISADAGHLIFSDKEQALKTTKKYKGSRFKVFKSKEEANSFCRSNKEPSLPTPKKSVTEDNGGSDVKASTESSLFKAPKPQEMMVVRKAIESGDVVAFSRAVWDNPRYLVSGGDTPAIYQEGCRYTALHVAALKNQPEMCQVILDTLENPEFVHRLYSQSCNTDETQSNRINFLVDLYLNMPDKGNCDSPLHMACKFGHVDVVEVLAAHPRTDRCKVNKWGDTPKDIICSRCSSPSKDMKEKIALLLEGQCYVPLIRSEDNSTPPVIAQPWSPDVNRSPLDIPQVTFSPKDPSMTVKAFAGPMSPSNAGIFHKKWTTPPSQSPDKARQYFNIKRSDCEKGLERIGRQLAHEMALPWLEHWNFLGLYVDLASEKGLNLLEEYFQKRVWILYLKQFREKYNIIDIFEDFTQFSTPIRGRGTDKRSDAINSSIANDTLAKGEVANEHSAKNCVENIKKDEENTVDVVEVSPVTGLAQQFAVMQLLDESWSDKATINTSNPALNNSQKLSDSSGSSGRSVSNLEDSVNINSEKSMEQGRNVSNGDNDIDGPSVSQASSSGDAAKTTIECAFDVNGNADVKVRDSCDGVNTDSNEENRVVEITVGKSGDENKDDRIDSIEDDKKKSSDTETVIEIGKKTKTDEGEEVYEVPPEDIKRTLKRSDSTASTSSFVTAVEDFTDSDQAFKSELSDPGMCTPCIYIKDGAIFEQLIKYSLQRSEGETDQTEVSTVKFVVQIKSSPSSPVTDVTIIYIPKEENANRLEVWEWVEVGKCAGDIATLSNGDLVEIGDWDGGERAIVSQSTLQAYISWSATMPKLGFIHGPQPTREDLDVSRALGSIVISPERHPFVFQWKIGLKKFQKDSSFKWQSPAKLRSRLSRPSPQQSPLRRTSPIIPYGSPVAVANTLPRSGITSNIRTKLFPSISE